MNKLNRKKAPPIKDAVDYQLELKPYTRIDLTNEVPVYCIHAGAEEVIQIEWVFDAGNWYEKENLVASATNYLLKNGTSSHTAYEINELFEYYGAYFNRSCHHDNAVLTLHCLNKHLPALLPIVQELITSAVFPEEELNIYKQNMKQRLHVNLKKCDFVANRLIDVYLYGEEHPYGRYSKEEYYDALTPEKLREFYHKHYKEGRCRIFVAGRLPADLEPLLEKHFGALPFHATPTPYSGHLIIPAKERQYRIENDPESVQGAIRMAVGFPDRRHPDFPKAQVLNALLGGFFGSRLMSNIREEKGYTYGIYSYLQNHREHSALMISTEAGKDVCEATVKEVYLEIQKLREEPVDEEELMLVKNYLMGGLLGDLDGPFQIMARWKNIILNDLEEDYFYRSIRTIRSITAEEMQAMAQKYLVPEEFYELIVI